MHSSIMRLSLAVLLLLIAACRTTEPQSLEDQSVRVELGKRVVSTLTNQEHYFANDAERAKFVERMESIASTTHDATGYYRALADALATLDEGHTGLVGSANVSFSDTIPPVALLELPEGSPSVGRKSIPTRAIDPIRGFAPFCPLDDGPGQKPGTTTFGS